MSASRASQRSTARSGFALGPDSEWAALFLYPTVDKDTNTIGVTLRAQRRAGLLSLAEIPIPDFLLRRFEPTLADQMSIGLAAIEEAARERGVLVERILVTSEGIEADVKRGRGS